MSGIPLAPWSIDADGCVAMLVRAQSDSATHIARPVPEDEAREAVVAAARALRAANDDLMARQEEYPDDAYIGAWIAFQAALEHLDALTKGDA